MKHSAHTIIVGGGLAGGLVALAKVEAGRGAGLVLVEEGATLGGNHTWSFHRTDLDADGWRLLAPLVSHRWARTEVRFPGRRRVIENDYATVTSEAFARRLASRLAGAGVRVMLGARAIAVHTDRVALADGTEIAGDVVFDARGPERASTSTSTSTGFQKFVGLELDLAEDGPWDAPVIIDAEEDVEQLDGFRFIYALPFSRRCVLLEDTVYSDNPTLDEAAFEARLLDYARTRGARVRRILRRETGVLPLPLRATSQPARADAPAALGYRGGFFHPVTGYSLPMATRVAVALATRDTRAEVATALAALRAELEQQQRFGFLLNRLMFEAMSPALRWNALERFYRLPTETIGRFYASRMTTWDRALMFAGRPPRGISWRRLFGASGVAA